MDEKIKVLGWEEFKEAFYDLVMTPEYYISSEQFSKLTRSYYQLKQSARKLVSPLEINSWDEGMSNVTTKMKLNFCPIRE
ncbi:MAG: hypothetical protein PVJ67_00870 [Candidatus Pacearchaeota archaeon]|jgi:hypothetical protein